MGTIGTQICEFKAVLRISKAIQPNNFWTISSAQNHCGCKKWSLTLRWGRDTQSFVVCRAHSGQHKSNWTLVEDVETFFASENPEHTLLSHLQTTISLFNIFTSSLCSFDRQEFQAIHSWKLLLLAYE